jgi:hypothetical protein
MKEHTNIYPGEILEIEFLKMKNYTLIILISLIGINNLKAQTNWQLNTDRIYSKWAKKVSPDNVWHEYPRPQMVRKQWLNLNGLWDYAITDSNKGSPGSYDGQILVPFAVESALSGVTKRIS